MTTIRKATSADLNPLSDLLAAQFAEHEIDLPIDELRAALTTLLENDTLGFCLLAEEEGRPLGFADIVFTWTLEYGGKTAWLEELYVLPEWRNAGIGAQLLDAVIVGAKNLGCKAIDLEVEEEHQRAENLYQRKGFHPLSRRRWAKEL